MRELLARNDVDPDKPDKYGDETPLWRASCNGYERVVRLLLARDDVNPSRPDRGGRTPLQIASLFKHTQILALLQPPIAGLSSID